MRVRRALGLALMIVVTGAFLLPLTAAATVWNGPFSLGTGGIKPSVAIDSTGKLHFVWWHYNSKVILYSRCTGLNGSSCSAPETLPNNGQDSYYPSIAIDPQDRPNVVWESRDAGSYSIFWSRREADGWTPIVKVSNEVYSELPDIAIGPQGKLHVVYQSKQNLTGYVYYAESSDGFHFAPAVQLDAIETSAPLPTLAESLPGELGAPEGDLVSPGLYPRVAADANDRAQVVWNAPTPYGIYYVFQKANGSFSSKITVSTGHKDQTPDIVVSPTTGAVGILWGTYDNFNAAFAEYNDTTRDYILYDIDGGLEQSLWPRLSVDCAGKFHFTFQGKVTASGNWNVYHRAYNPNNNRLAGRETIAASSAQEQTPVIASTNIAAIIYINTTSALANMSAANLNTSCASSPTRTASPTSTASSTATATRTATHTPTQTTAGSTATATATSTKTQVPTNTPTRTATATATATTTLTSTPSPTATHSPTATATTLPRGKQHIGNKSSQISWSGQWKRLKNAQASNRNFARCDNGSRCRDNWSAELKFVGGTRIEWETAYANTQGLADVYIDGKLFERVDLCKGNPNSGQLKFARRTYLLQGGPTASHSIRIVALGQSSNCSRKDGSYVTVDGFNIYR